MARTISTIAFVLGAVLVQAAGKSVVMRDSMTLLQINAAGKSVGMRHARALLQTSFHKSELGGKGAQLARSNTSQQHVQSSPLSVHDDTKFKIRDFVPPDGHVDVVITWNCEDLAWIGKISPVFAPILTVVLLHKLDKEEEHKRPKCLAALPKTPFNVSVVRLPNRGRDIHSPFSFITNNYHTLAGYTMFLQADQHWALRWVPPDDRVPNASNKVRHFANNAEAVNDFISMALRKRTHFIPLMPYLKEDSTPMLFADRESNLNKSIQDAIITKESQYVFTFDNGVQDLYNAPREMYSILFGGSPCDAPSSSPLTGVTFVPGFQFMISRHAIQKRPRHIWAALTDLTLECVPVGYAIERLSLEIFNSEKEIVQPEKWTKPSCCHLDPAYFSEPFDVYRGAKFWRQKWGCEPLSDFLVSQ